MHEVPDSDHDLDSRGALWSRCMGQSEGLPLGEGPMRGKRRNDILAARGYWRGIHRPTDLPSLGLIAEDHERIAYGRRLDDCRYRIGQDIYWRKLRVGKSRNGGPHQRPIVLQQLFYGEDVNRPYPDSITVEWLSFLSPPICTASALLSSC